MPLVTPEELAKYPPPPLPHWVSDLGLLAKPESQITFLRPESKSGKPGEPYWHSNVGAQSWALICPYDEIMIGGERGGSKSAALIAWFAMGSLLLPPDDPARYSYLLEPSYRGLMLRKEYQSMGEFVDEATDFFGPLGGKPKDDPVVFTFKSGAKIYTNHLGDKSAFEKYRGLGITRIGIEELTQIEEEASYLKLLGSLRAKKQLRIHHGKTFPALRSQIMSTANPDGAGKKWVKNRFVKVLDNKGNLIPRNHPIKDPITHLRRIFIPMRRLDNPYLRNNKQYEGFLLSQDETTQQAWIHGNWDADSGTFFLEWRPSGPVTAEERDKYPWAKHVIDPVELRPYYFRFGGGDWGFDHPAVFHKFCKNDKDGRIHVYDELILRGCGSFEMGVKLANWWLPDLEYLPDKTVTIAFSSDAFSVNDNTPTKADQVAAGIKSVLGPYGAFLLKFTDDERKLMEKDPGMASRLLQRHRENAPGKFVIALKPASKDTAARWSYMRELLRFRPVVQEAEADLKARLMETFSRAGRDGDAQSAVMAYERELARVKRPDAQVLPRLQVWRKCAGLIRCMEEANKKDEDHPDQIAKWNAVDGIGGDDPLESCFVAGTLIQTETGPRPIEKISVGDLVYTRAGLRPVLKAGMTKSQTSVQTMHLSDGTTLTGTQSHPIFIQGKEFVRLDSIGYGDTVETWLAAKPSSLTGSNSDVTQNLHVDTFGTITGPAAITGKEELVLSIKKFGDLSMDLFRMAFIFITKMRIPSTTIYPTLSLNPGACITMSTDVLQRGEPGYGQFSPWARKWLRRGTLLKPGSHGIRKTENTLCPSELKLMSSANNAGLNIKASSLKRLCIVQRNATTNTAEPIIWMMLQRIANCAQNHSFQTRRMVPDSAPVHVVRLGATKQAPVYNLTVAENPEYYANGILVHNCGHGLHHFKEVEKTMPKSYYLTERMEEIQTQYEGTIGERLTDPTRLIMVHQTQAARFDKANPSNGGSFTPPRASSTRHRNMRPGVH